MPAPRRTKRSDTTLERVHEWANQLDAALARNDERFGLGEITAKEMDQESEG
jgi:hypothetical protein